MLTPEQIRDNFKDIEPALTADHALTEANRCLYCYDAPCMHACPTHIDIPEFIRRIATRNLEGSARAILESNIMGSSCARVCPVDVLCEGACVYHHLQMPPIEIGRLQRYATDHVIANQISVLQKRPEQLPFKVAVIGGGPAGLACAAELGLLGYHVVVFEAAKEAGGLNRYGIAPYKITNEEAQAEVLYIQKMTGFEIKTGVRVGQDLPLKQLEADYDAVYLGIGLGGTRPLGIPGEELKGVVGATEFIEGLRNQPYHQTWVGRRVAVIGAGNTAIDAATEVARLGAEEVTIVYRRGLSEKPCYEFEYELALKDRVRFLWHTQPVEIVGEGGAVSGLRCQKMAPGEKDDSGRPRAVPVAGSEFLMPLEMVIKASGQSVQKKLFDQIADLRMKGSRVAVDDNFQTSNPKYFAGGDCISGGKEVVNAAAEGKAAARAIHRHLSKTKVSSSTKGGN